jgi:hypothetical protein
MLDGISGSSQFRRALREVFTYPRCYNLRLHANVIDDRHHANDGDASALSMILKLEMNMRQGRAIGPV